MFVCNSNGGFRVWGLLLTTQKKIKFSLGVKTDLKGSFLGLCFPTFSIRHHMDFKKEVILIEFLVAR